MSENIETLQRSTRVIPAPPEVKAHRPIFRIMKRPTKPPSQTQKSFGMVLPKNSTGSHHGIKSWSGIIPGPNGFLAPPAIFPITA